MTLPFDHTHDLDLGVSRSESEIALSQEWGSLLTMNEKDASHPFMTMILTCVTMVGWAEHSDRGDFRCRRAGDISSFYYVYLYKCFRDTVPIKINSLFFQYQLQLASYITKIVDIIIMELRNCSKQ